MSLARVDRTFFPSPTVAEQLAEVYFSNRYPGFDLDDPDWPVLRTQLAAIAGLAATIRARLA